MSNKKQLTLSELKTLDSKLNTIKQVTLSNDYTIQIDTKFRNSVIEEIFEKIQSVFKLTQEDESFSNFPVEKYILLQVILNFTSLKNMKISSIKNELQLMKILIDQEDEISNKNLFEEILEKFNEVVPEELERFNVKMFDIMQNRLMYVQQQQKMFEKLNEELEKQGSDDIVLTENTIEEDKGTVTR